MTCCDNKTLDFSIIFIALVLPLIFVHQKLLLYQEFDIAQKSLNVSLKYSNINDDQVVIFARVPKTASQTFNLVLDEMRYRNNFSIFSSVTGMPTVNDDSENIYLPNSNWR
jgi:hypothetical protein